MPVPPPYMHHISSIEYTTYEAQVILQNTYEALILKNGTDFAINDNDGSELMIVEILHIAFDARKSAVRESTLQKLLVRTSRRYTVSTHRIICQDDERDLFRSSSSICKDVT